MRKLTALLLICFLSFQISCDNKSADTKSSSEKKDSSTAISEPKQASKDSIAGTTIKAKFENFQFGDASHFIFKDESGKEWEQWYEEFKTHIESSHREILKEIV